VWNIFSEKLLFVTPARQFAARIGSKSKESDEIRHVSLTEDQASPKLYSALVNNLSTYINKSATIRTDKEKGARL